MSASDSIIKSSDRGSVPRYVEYVDRCDSYVIPGLTRFFPYCGWKGLKPSTGLFWDLWEHRWESLLLSLCAVRTAYRLSLREAGDEHRVFSGFLWTQTRVSPTRSRAIKTAYLLQLREPGAHFRIYSQTKFCRPSSRCSWTMAEELE